MKKSFLVPVIFIFNFCIFLFGGALFIAIWEYLCAANPNGAFFSASFLNAVYFFSPITCALAIFSVFAFMMRRYPEFSPKIFLSIFFLLIMFASVYALFTPFLYSKTTDRDIQIRMQNQSMQGQRMNLSKDEELKKFIKPPLFISEGNRMLSPLLYKFYTTYKNSYVEYLIIAGAFFLMIFSFWVCAICTNWKILNFLLMPTFAILSLYGYNRVMNMEFIDSIRAYLPFELNFYSMHILYFSVIAVLFFIYGTILLIVRHAKNVKKRPKRPKQAKRVKKTKKEKKLKEPKAPKAPKEKKSKEERKREKQLKKEEKRREKELKREEKKRAKEEEKKEKAKRQPRQSRLKKRNKKQEIETPQLLDDDILEAPDPSTFVMEPDYIDIPEVDTIDMEDYKND